MLCEPLQRRAACERDQVLRFQRITEIYKPVSCELSSDAGIYAASLSSDNNSFSNLLVRLFISFSIPASVPGTFLPKDKKQGQAI